MAPVHQTDSGQVRLAPATASTELTLPEKVWKGLTSKIKGGEYSPRDKDGNPNPIAPEPYRYGDGPNDYIAVTFEPSVVLIRDGNDSRGLALQFTNDEWERLGGVDRDDDETEPSEKVDNLRNSNDPTVPTTNTQTESDLGDTGEGRGDGTGNDSPTRRTATKSTGTAKK